MTDKEKLCNVISIVGAGSFEDFMMCYLTIFHNDFSLYRVYELIRKIETQAMEGKIRDAENLRYTANEMATYIKHYLEGKMFTNREAAEANVDRQIDNAQAIIDACKGENK